MWSGDAADCIVQTGEILIARSNTPELVGRVAMFNGEAAGAVASDLTIRILPGSDIDAEFLTRYLSALYVSGYWRERAGGASGSMKKITRSQILAELIPVHRSHRAPGRISKRSAVTRTATAAAAVAVSGICRLVYRWRLWPSSSAWITPRIGHSTITATSVNHDPSTVPVIRHRRPMPRDANKVRVVACIPTIDGVELCKTLHRFQSLIMNATDHLGRTGYHADGVNVATR
jgi:hypothetical protein